MNATNVRPLNQMAQEGDQEALIWVRRDRTGNKELGSQRPPPTRFYLFIIGEGWEEGWADSTLGVHAQCGA